MSAHSLRILVVHNRYRSAQPSGEDRVVDQELSLLQEAGHDVALYEKRSDDIASMSLMAKAAIPFQVPWNSAVRSELRAHLRREQPDIVHIHNTFPLLSPSVVAACEDTGTPAVATLHNYSMVCPPGTLHRDGRICTDCVRTQPLPAVKNGCYRNSRVATVPLAVSLMANRRRWWSGISRFLCTSNAQRQVLVEAGMPGEKLAVKHNFVPEPRVVRTGPGAHFLYLGRMTEEKGVRVLMRAWETLAAQGGPGVPLTLAGAGPMQGEVARWADGRDDVRYVGLRSRADCIDLTARAVAVVAPSTWKEVFGLIVVEAMAAGTPTVAAGHGAFVELIDDGRTGLLHEPGDADSLADCMRRVSANLETNQLMGQAARRRYEDGFTPAVGLRRLLAEYTDVITAAGRKSRLAPMR